MFLEGLVCRVVVEEVEVVGQAGGGDQGLGERRLGGAGGGEGAEVGGGLEGRVVAAGRDDRELQEGRAGLLAVGGVGEAAEDFEEGQVGDEEGGAAEGGVEPVGARRAAAGEVGDPDRGGSASPLPPGAGAGAGWITSGAAGSTQTSRPRRSRTWRWPSRRRRARSPSSITAFLVRWPVQRMQRAIRSSST